MRIHPVAGRVVRRAAAVLLIGGVLAQPVSCAAPGPSLPGGKPFGREFPVGYDHPESDRGGPAVPEGLGWLEKVWPRALKMVSGEFAGGRLTVMFITNFSSVDKLHELNRRFPLDALVVAPESTHTFAGRERFYEALRSRPKIDCFILSRVNPATIPADVQYEMLRRVKEEGAGLAVIDFFEHSDTLNPGFLGLKPVEKGPEIIPGIPYGGLRKWELTKKTDFVSFNYWHSGGSLYSEPKARPYNYGEVSVSPFGKGRVVWASTNSHWQRYYYARTLLPQIDQNRSMWVESDYFYSHTGKVILKAAGRTPEAEIKAISPRGRSDGTETPVVTFARDADEPFTGKLRWQIRGTWGLVSARGEMPLAVPAKGGSVRLDGVRFEDAGRRFLDLWVENERGETVDWGSAFVEVDKGVPPPAITFQHPDGAPRGSELKGTITVRDAPAGASVRVTLIDRYWREVGLVERPLATGKAAYSFPSKGLDGQIWRVQADVLGPVGSTTLSGRRGADGHVLARSYLNVTSPHTRATRGGFHPLVSALSGANPEEAAEREYVRRLGFLANRQYQTGNALVAEAQAWSDIQMMPFPFRLSCQNTNYKEDHISDWEDPALKAEMLEGTAFLTREMKRFGLRGYNITDDSAPSPELPAGAYTAIRFHEWLRREYGRSFDEVCKAWGWKPEVEDAPPDELPCDPYVVVEFHKWLKRKYKTLPEVAKAWKLKPHGFGSMHLFGTIRRGMIEELRKSGNTAPHDDAKAFMQERRRRRRRPDPFGRITAASIKKAHGAGVTAPWIDAQRFLQERWVDYMTWMKEALTDSPEVLVGTDAAFYAQAMSDSFSTADYVAPYYKDRAVKVAVSRGRTRRPGDYGATLGAYGERPANMTGRRSTVWQILFAGGTGCYFWMLSPSVGMNPNLTLSDKHAKYQCEVVEEVMSGIGELFTGCERIFHPAMILDSQTSGICDQLEAKLEPVTSQRNSTGAFQCALEDLGVNPHTIISRELAGEWFVEHRPKLLLLPGVNSMSDDEIEAVRKFVRAGGVVVADVLPGLRRPNGNPRDRSPLADVFGVEYDLAGKARRVRGKLTGRAEPGGEEIDFGEALADPRVKAAGRLAEVEALGSLEGAPTLLVNRFGRGRAFLFNASFSSYATYRTEGGEIWRPWHEVVRHIVTAAGIEPEFTWTSAGEETPGFEVSGFRNGAAPPLAPPWTGGGGYLLGVEDLGCGDFTGERRPIEIKLPGSFHVYDTRAGKYLDRTGTLEAELPRGGHRAYSLTPYKVWGVKLRADRRALSAGETVTLSINILIDDGMRRNLHVIRLEAFDPSGESFFPFRRVLRMPEDGPITVPLTTAFNDEPGRWTFVATDVVSGETATVTVEVEAGAGIGGDR